tara:strand:+ start:386 stop:745 length:360 start_codon:yes stop_codon:yes gene_type:complete
MATLTAQKITDTGIVGVMSTATAAGDEFINTGLEFLFFQNEHATNSYDVTVTAQVTNIHHQNFGTVVKENIVKTVAAQSEVFIGPFKQAAFNDSNHKVQITYSATPTTMNVAVLYLDQQ